MQAQCRSSGKIGHLQSQCRNKKQTGHNNPSRTNYVQEEELIDVPELDAAVFRVTKNSSKAVGVKPIIIPVVIEGVPLEMELDTGAAVSIVSYIDYLKHFCHVPLSATTNCMVIQGHH